MPDPLAQSDLRRRALSAALVSANRALRRTALNADQCYAARMQFKIIDTISRMAKPDWAHIDALVARLLSHIGDSAPDVGIELRAWAEKYSANYKAASGS